LTQTLGDIPRESRYQMVAGKYHEAINQFEAAIAASQIAIDLAREANLPEIEIAALATLGDVYDQQGNYTEAITTAEIVLDRSRQANDSTWRSDALSTLASAHSSLNNYDQAISYAEESLQIAQTENDHGVMIEALATLYGVYLDLGDFEQAAQLADRVTQTVNDNNPSSQNTARFVETFDGLIDAINAFVAGDYPLTVRASETALASLEEITLADNIKAQFSALMYLFAGIGYSGLDQHAAAIENVSNGLDIFRDSEYAAADATAAFMAGNVYYRAGDLDTALSLYTEALAIEPDSHYVEAGIARLYRDRGLPNVAISHYKQAVNQVEQVRGNVRNLSSNLEESFFDAFVSIDGLRIADIYRELADLLLTQGRIAEAQQVLELLKLEELREFEGAERSGQQSDLALNTTEAQIIDEYGSLIAFGQEVLACQQSRCSDLSQLLDRRDALTAQFNTTLTTLEADIRERLSVDRGALDTQDFRKSAAAVVEAQPNSLLIYPLILEDKLWLLWAAEGGVLKSVEINAVGQRDLSQAILQFRQLIETPNSNISEIKAVGQQLYDWLLAPLEGEIEANNIENLVFALDRTTRYLPMGALFDGETYLIEKYTVSTILSAGETDMVDRLPAAEQTSILAMGLSDSVEGFSALPNVPVELASIVIETDDAADETGIYQGQLFLNQNFDRRTLRDNLSYHAVAHIATHAEFVPGSHEDSYLLLGTGEQLKISDIQALQDLNNTHLIVLSACETALSGPDQDGIEISGVAHQFLEGGAKAVMASLWKVNDASTSVLMQLFYQQLAAGTGEQPVTKAKALRQAQLTLLNDEEDIQLALANLSRSGERFGGFDNTFRARRPDQGYRHPYYWAPFVLIGNNL
ncbi:MAG: CHAT domain-containing protein, partial [Cyanobacteria bacterium P01_D01_bin.44]